MFLMVCDSWATASSTSNISSSELLSFTFVALVEAAIVTGEASGSNSAREETGREGALLVQKGDFAEVRQKWTVLRYFKHGKMIASKIEVRDRTGKITYLPGSTLQILGRFLNECNMFSS